MNGAKGAYIYNVGCMMYPMVQNQQRKKQEQEEEQQQQLQVQYHQQQQHRQREFDQSDVIQQQQQQHQQHSDDIEDTEQQEEGSSQIHHRSQRPLYRRFFSYVREAWTGVKFALGKQNIICDVSEKHIAQFDIPTRVYSRSTKREAGYVYNLFSRGRTSHRQFS